jgi:hypothetical protein
VILPLTVGNQWIYIDSVFSAKGSFESVDTVKLGISGKTNIVYQGKNVEVFYWNWYDGNQPDEVKWLCRNEEGGCYGYGLKLANSKLVLGKSQWLKYPASAGDSWKVITYSKTDTTDYAPDTVIYSCRSINEKFKTVKGEMECYDYYSRSTYDGQVNEQYMYFAKNIGYVGLISKIDGIIRDKYVLLSSTVSGTIAKAAPRVSGKRNRQHFSFPLK